MRFCNKAWPTLALAGFISFAAEPGPTFHAGLNSALEAAAADKSPVLVIVSAAGTRSAREVDQALTAENLKKIGNVKIASVNTDLNPDVAQKFSVTILPAFILLGPDG